MAIFSVFVVLALSARGMAFPRYAPSSQYEPPQNDPPQQGVVITAPPRPSFTGSLLIPDSAHPYMPPGPDDERGPCPGLNTLANHGYIPRNGIATFEEMVTGSVDGFNFDYDLVAAITASGVLARGNPLINKMSIGRQSPLVPALPGHPDGPVAKGLAEHGRFEGDASITRDDAFIGDNKGFQPHLYQELLSFVERFGNDSTVTGPKSIVTAPAMREFKYQRYLDSQSQNAGFEYRQSRMAVSYGEASFTLYFFANGTDGTLSVPSMTSFFRDERFPDNHYRAAAPGDLTIIRAILATLYQKYPIQPGANSENGTYVNDGTPFNNCSLYYAFGANNVPVSFLNTTGLTRRNVDFLLDVVKRPFPECDRLLPASPIGI